MTILIIYFLLLLLLLKIIIITLSLIPLKFYFVLLKKRYNGRNISEGNFSDKPKKHSLKNQISRYLQGYSRYVVIQVGFIPSHFIRRFIYKHFFCVELGEKAIIYYNSEIRAPYNLKIGIGTIIGDRSVLDARNEIIIGENVNFSSHVSIWTEQHDYNDIFFACNPSKTGSVIIKDRAWIGPNVTILPNVTIGEGAVVGAGSVVTKNVPSFTLVGGIPAKKIGDRNKEICYEFDGRPLPFY